MQPKHVRKIVVTAVVAGTFLLSTSWIAAADGTRQSSGSPALRTIMRDMGKNMQVITDGISREDWGLVARTAPLLADHPQPSMAEKVRLLGFLGNNAGAFRGYDEKSRHAAQALGLAARQRDGEAAIASFATLQGSCLGCHQRFRKSFVEKFHEKR
ncbi:MAG TPA: cytochrome C [Lysobacter sp.]